MSFHPSIDRLNKKREKERRKRNVSVLFLVLFSRSRACSRSISVMFVCLFIGIFNNIDFCRSVLLLIRLNCVIWQSNGNFGIYYISDVYTNRIRSRNQWSESSYFRLQWWESCCRYHDGVSGRSSCSRGSVSGGVSVCINSDSKRFPIHRKTLKEWKWFVVLFFFTHSLSLSLRHTLTYT